MKSYGLTPAAEDDLFEIWIFIAGDNPLAADRVEADIFKAANDWLRSPTSDISAAT